MAQSQSQLITTRHYTTWQILKLYWQSDQRFSAYLFAFVVITMTMILVGFDVALSYWSNYFFNALQAYNLNQSIWLLVLFFVLATFYIVFGVYRYYISQLFGLRWRNWLTQQFVNRWLMHRDYYYLENFDVKTDNPDQRIQEDISNLVSFSLSLSIGLVGSVTTFLAFIYVLWDLSGVIPITLGSLGTFNIPGYLVWVAVIYSILGTYFAFKIGFPLVALNFEQQRREATFRFAAIDLRSHSENVALYGGEHHQKNILFRLFQRVLENWYFIILRQKSLLWFTLGYSQVAVALPMLVALPNYFRKVFLLGGVMQSIRAFGQIQEALSFFITSYTTIAEWRAVNQRLITFLNHLEEIGEQVKKQTRLQMSTQDENKIVAQQLSIATPLGEQLLKNINQEFKHGDYYLIKGASGLGKSSFIRTLAGIWPYAAGEVRVPKNKKIMFLPQKPYMPIGTLAEAILFPDQQQVHLKDRLPEVMQACHLERFISRLGETAPWSEQLSPGEQQRIAFARILLHQPDWVFLDESTSMLDAAHEEALYEVLKNKLPQCSIVSVGHGPTLESYHNHIIDMGKYRIGGQA